MARIAFYKETAGAALKKRKAVAKKTREKLSKSLEEVHKTGRKKDGSPAKYKKAAAKKTAAKPPKAKAAEKAKTSFKAVKSSKSEPKQIKAKSEWGKGSKHEAQLVELLGDKVYEAGKNGRFVVHHYKKEKVATVTDSDSGDTKFFHGTGARGAARRYANHVANKATGKAKPKESKAAAPKGKEKNPSKYGYPTTGRKIDPDSRVAKLRAKGVSDDDIVDKIDKDVVDFTRGLKEGHGTSEIIAGSPGTGKSFLVERELGKENRGDTWERISGGAVTPRALYSFLYRNRNGKVLVLDDVDAFKNIDMVNMLKGALDSDLQEVSWESQGTRQKPKGMSEDDFYAQLDKELDASEAGDDDADNGVKKKKGGKKVAWKPPAKFKFTSKVVFITNKPMKKILNDPNIGAVASRSSKVDYDYDDRLIMTKLRKTWKHVEADKLPEDDRKRIFDMIETSYKKGNLQNISMRVMKNAINQKRTSGITWDRLQEMIEDGSLA